MKVALLISGGVDSSVALAQLKAQGHEVTAFYLKIWLEEELSFLGECPWEDDLSYVRRVCEQFNVPLEIVPLQKEYKDRVIAYTINEVTQGRTPNPDIMCNTFIKCGAFLEFLQPRGFDKIATGHYAGLIQQDGIYYLEKTPDPVKDQTYFLSRLSQEQLSHLMFPLAGLTKEEVRSLAHRYNLINKDRKDSQGLCFLGKIKFKDFIKEQIGTRPGPLVEFETGTVLAQHEGFWFYTIGQRQGLGLSAGPWYVVAKNTHTNTVFISKSYHAADKSRDTLTIKDCLWTDPAKRYEQLSVKLRHGPEEYTAHLHYNNDGSVNLQLDRRDQGIAPGQCAVLYDKNICVGSGIID